jgi:hypothetical protein
MKHHIALLAGLASMSLVQAAVPTLINFETPTSFASVLEHYNGGTDGAAVAGTNLGASFTADALGLMNDAAGPYFSNAPSPLGVMAPVGANSTLNVAGGFTSFISFWYSSSAFVLQGVNVYSGLNGTGSLLASFNLVNNAQVNGCTSSPYCLFDQVTSTFSGVGKSVTFGNAANVAAFDNINISVVPETTTTLMMSLGLAGLWLARRRLG